MNREEFLRILKDSLSMSLDEPAINSQIAYYDKYISDEIKKGKTEKEVIEELGDPRLIAKTIKTVNSNNLEVNYNDSFNEQKYDYNNKYENDRYGNKKISYRSFTTNTTPITCAIIFLIVFIIVFSILRLFGSVVYGVGAMAFNAPIAFMIIVMLFIWLFGSNRR